MGSARSVIFVNLGNPQPSERGSTLCSQQRGRTEEQRTARTVIPRSCCTSSNWTEGSWLWLSRSKMLSGCNLMLLSSFTLPDSHLDPTRSITCSPQSRSR